MSKAVVYTLLTTAFIVLVILSLAITTTHKDYRPHGLSRRLGFKIPPLLFDPLVVKMERIAEEKGLDDRDLPTNWETSTLAKELDQKDAANFLSDDGMLNITLRLKYLFPFLDNAPKDGFVESKELEAWILRQADDRLTYRTEKELALRDKDGDGAISFQEYNPQFSNEDLARNGMGHGEAGWWKEQFKNADIDHNGILNFYEFKEPIDYDHDEKLDFIEFKNGGYDNYKNYIEFETEGANIPSPEDVFEKLDANKNKLLEVDELTPILQYLSPGELSYAKYYAGYLIHEASLLMTFIIYADEDGDGKLTLDEMIMHEYIFYNTVYGEEFDDYDDFHDEL
ncbi:calcium-binding EF hand family protein [Actinidia rufa]|uniref:Calcium-binding EF hand family protein n=1 Tax=Actinidia rufa TaxID=165716 RepID=A0A7J0EC21_9ERIC|nr:calcium-binding EF hand family protein [Actinidia rufa]